MELHEIYPLFTTIKQWLKQNPDYYVIVDENQVILCHKRKEKTYTADQVRQMIADALERA